MQVQLKVPESGRIGASLGKCHFTAEMVQNGARLANGAHTTPPPRIFHSLTVYNVFKLNLMHGWGWQWAKHGGGKASWPRLGGPMVGTTSAFASIFE